MKTRLFHPKKLLMLWLGSIEMKFFPGALVQELKPRLKLDAWGDNASYI